MIIISTVLFSFAASVMAAQSDVHEDVHIRSSNLRRGLQHDNSRRMVAPCTLVLRIEDYADNTEKFEWECDLDLADKESGSIVSFPHNKFAKDRFVSGVSTLHGDVTISRGKATIHGNPVFGRRPGGRGLESAEKGTDSHRNNSSRSLQDIQVTKTVLALRVQANDISTSSTEAVISNEIFGTDGTDVFNLASAYSQCSYDTLNFVAGTQDSRVGNDGVYNVVLNENVGGLTDTELRNKVIAAAEAELGTLRTQYDHVMICLPNIAGFGGIAYAFVNSWLSVYKDLWCNYPSAQIHEIGHNINLAHSGEGSEQYADQTGMMGYSYSSDEGPRMCFNNAKNWQLGWYLDKRSIAAPLTSNWIGELVGFAEYTSASSTQSVLLKVEGHTVDYYVGFNRAIGINSGTREAANLVTIQSRSVGTGYALSSLVAKLGTGGSFTISNFGGITGETVVISVDSISITASPGVAVVRVFKESNPTASPTKVPTKTPTKSPSAGPSVSPTTASPTGSSIPSLAPSASPTRNPTAFPTAFPTSSPVAGPQCSLITKAKTCRETAGCFWEQGQCKNSTPVVAPTPTAPTPTAPTPTAPTPTAPTPTTNVGCATWTSFGKKTCINNGCRWFKGSCVDP